MTHAHTTPGKYLKLIFDTSNFLCLLLFVDREGGGGGRKEEPGARQLRQTACMPVFAWVEEEQWKPWCQCGVRWKLSL